MFNEKEFFFKKKIWILEILERRNKVYLNYRIHLKMILSGLWVGYGLVMWID